MIRSHRRVLFTFAGLAVALLGAGASHSARVVDVRVGLHEQVTRVVIELDAPSGHRIERQDAREGGTLAVRLDARSERRHILSRSELVEDVTLEPGDAGVVARIALREPGLDYSELVLDAPPRIVIDIRRPAVAAAPGQARSTAAPRAHTTELAQQPPAARPVATDDLGAPPAARPDRAEEGVAPPATQGTADARPAGAGDRVPVAPPASYRALVAAQQEREAREEPLARGPSAVATSPSPPPAASLPSPPAAASPPSPPAAASPPSPASAATPPSPVSIASRPSPPAVASPPPSVDSGPAPLRSRLQKVDPAAVLLGLAGLAAAAIVYRRLAVRRTQRLALGDEEGELAIFGDARGRTADPEAPPASFSEEDDSFEGRSLSLVPPPDEDTSPAEPAPEDAPLQGWQSLAVPPAAEPQISALPLGDQIGAISLEPHVAALPLEPHAASLPLEPQIADALLDPATAAPESERRIGALEQRIASLEALVEDLVEARARLERFAAAQNEELRVQRAAIARTQRVLRGMPRTDDQGTEAGTQPGLPLAGD